MPVATSPKRKRKRPKKSVVYDLIQRERLKVKISRITCSPWWTDHALATCERYGVPPESKHVASALSLYHIYPPPAENTPMKSCRCKHCKGVRMWPAYYIRSSGVSTECAYEAMGRDRMAAIGGSESSVRVFTNGTRDQL
jgi:hypothetical protein